MTKTTRKMRPPAKVGDKVVACLPKSHPSYPNGTIGRVVAELHGACGPILAVQFSGYDATVDLYWRKVRSL